MGILVVLGLSGWVLEPGKGCQGSPVGLLSMVSFTGRLARTLVEGKRPQNWGLQCSKPQNWGSPPQNCESPVPTIPTKVRKPLNPEVLQCHHPKPQAPPVVLTFSKTPQNYPRKPPEPKSPRHRDLHGQQPLASVLGVDGELHRQTRRHSSGVEPGATCPHLAGVVGGQRLHLEGAVRRNLGGSGHPKTPPEPPRCPPDPPAGHLLVAVEHRDAVGPLTGRNVGHALRPVPVVSNIHRLQHAWQRGNGRFGGFWGGPRGSGELKILWDGLKTP